MADVLAVRNEYRLQTWAEIIRECRESGLNGVANPHPATPEEMGIHLIRHTPIFWLSHGKAAQGLM